MPIETNEPERRVLAHERILQASFAALPQDQPDVLGRPKATFGAGHTLVSKSSGRMR